MISGADPAPGAVSIGSRALGRFSFLALYPFDTQVILRIPPRSSTQNTGSRETPEKLCDLLNDARLTIKPEIPGPPLTFRVEPLATIFTDSPNATWSALGADIPGEWFRPALNQGALPAAAELSAITARLLLFDGGIAILALEPTFLIRNLDKCADRLPDIIKQAGEQTVRYENPAVTSFCRSLLVSFGAALQDAVDERGADRPTEIRRAYKPFVDRIRTVSVPEAYPTIITKISCRSGFRPSTYELNSSDLRHVMYLDGRELTNALPSFEEDLIAVGYDSVWWLLAAEVEERTDRFPDRIELTFEYALAFSMLIYVLHTEIDRELREIRTQQARAGRAATTEVQVRKVQSLRGEVEDLLKELSLESFSTWISDIRLFDRILENWLVRASSEALRAKLDTANVILRELYQDRAESEQRELTRLGTIFAGASLASLFIAAVTLFFTQTQWETQDHRLAIVLFVAKVLVVIYLVVLPPLLVVQLWARRIHSTVENITQHRQ